MPTLPAPAYPVAAQTYLPPLHDLLRTVTPTPSEPGSRWETGIVWEPEGWQEVTAVPGAWCGSDYEAVAGLKPAEGPPDVVYYQPFQLVTSYSCKIGRTGQERRDKVRRFLEAGQSKAIEHELWTGEISDVSDSGNMRLAVAGSGVADALTAADLSVVVNPGFVPASLNPASAVPVSLGAGFALLSQALADYGPGSKGMIHVTPTVGELAVNNQQFVEDRNVLRTRSRGDLIVVGSGYPGTGPGGSVPTGGLTWLHATSMVQVRLGDIIDWPETDAEAVNRKTNEWTVRAERTAAAYWDGLFQASVLVDLNLGADDDLGWAT